MEITPKVSQNSFGTPNSGLAKLKEHTGNVTAEDILEVLNSL
jgi:hypothetical protein